MSANEQELTGRVIPKERITEEIFLGAKEIDDRLTEVARIVASKYKGQELVVVGVMKGSFMLMADFARKLSEVGMDETQTFFDFIDASSYKGTQSTGEVNLEFNETKKDFSGRKVLLVEDIVDTARTLTKVCDWMLQQGVESLETFALLSKPDRRAEELKDFNTTYTGFVIPDEFVVGYGLDYNQKYRSLPYIRILQSHEIN